MELDPTASEKFLATVRILHALLPRRPGATQPNITVDNLLSRESLGGIPFDHRCDKESCDMINELIAIERGYLPKSHVALFPSIYVGRCGRIHACWNGGDVLSPCRVDPENPRKKGPSGWGAPEESSGPICALTGAATKFSGESFPFGLFETELDQEDKIDEKSANHCQKGEFGGSIEAIRQFLSNCRKVRPARRSFARKRRRALDANDSFENRSDASSEAPPAFCNDTKRRRRMAENLQTDKECMGPLRHRISGVVDVRAAIVPFCNPNSVIDPFMESYGKLSAATDPAKRKQAESATRRRKAAAAAVAAAASTATEAEPSLHRFVFVEDENGKDKKLRSLLSNSSPEKPSRSAGILRANADEEERRRKEAKKIQFPVLPETKKRAVADVRTIDYLGSRFARTCEENVGLTELDRFYLAYFENEEVARDLRPLFRKAADCLYLGEKKNRVAEAKTMVRNVFYGPERRDRIKEQIYTHHSECAKSIYRSHCAKLETYKGNPSSFRALDVLEYLPMMFSSYRSANTDHMDLLKLPASEAFVDFFGEMCWFQWCVVCAGSAIRENRTNDQSKKLPKSFSANKSATTAPATVIKKEKNLIPSFSNCALALLYDLVHGFYFGEPPLLVVPQVDYAFKYAPFPGEICRYGYEKKNLTCGMVQRTAAYKVLQDDGSFSELYKVHFSTIARLNTALQDKDCGSS